MRWIGALFVAAALLSTLVACDDQKEEAATTPKATPDNTDEATCRKIKECDEELKRRQKEITGKFWERTAPKEIPPPDIDTNAHSDDAKEQTQSDQPAESNQ